VDVEHLQGSELFDYGTWGESCGHGAQARS
jgi:hypothetical protein